MRILETEEPGRDRCGEWLVPCASWEDFELWSCGSEVWAEDDVVQLRLRLR